MMYRLAQSLPLAREKRPSPRSIKALHHASPRRREGGREGGQYKYQKHKKYKPQQNKTSKTTQKDGTAKIGEAGPYMLQQLQSMQEPPTVQEPHVISAFTKA